MKITPIPVILLVTLILCQQKISNAAIANGRFSPNSIILQLIEMMRRLIINGDAANGVPIADPYVFNVHQFTVGGIINGEVNITNGILTGLGRFRVEHLEFSKEDESINIEFTVPRLKFEADYYEMQGDIYKAIPIAGSGIAYILATDITLNTKVFMKPSDDGRSVLIDRLEDTHFTFGKILSFTQYDKNIDAILNALIEDFLATKLSRFSRYLAATYQGQVVAALNSVLGAYDTWSILAMISS